MSNRDDDGQDNSLLSDVSAEVLAASKDPVAWREQRKAAIRAKILGGTATAGGTAAAGTAGSDTAAKAATVNAADVAKNKSAVDDLLANRRRARAETAPAGPPSIAEREDSKKPEPQPAPAAAAAPAPAAPSNSKLPEALRLKLQAAAAAAAAEKKKE